MTNAEVVALLSHPDAHVRSLADWAREARGIGWRGPKADDSTARRVEDRLAARLAALAAHGLVSSDQYYL